VCDMTTAAPHHPHHPIRVVQVVQWCKGEALEAIASPPLHHPSFFIVLRC
jgi:hypothetical protein